MSSLPLLLPQNLGVSCRAALRLVIFDVVLPWLRFPKADFWAVLPLLVVPWCWLTLSNTATLR